MRIEREFAIYALLLVALAANPVWFFPNAGEDADRYRAVELDEEDWLGYPEWHPNVKECNIAMARGCSFETAALEGGVLVNSSEVESGATYRYDYIVFPSGFYEPAMESTGEGVHLTLEPRTPNEVVRNLSYSYSEASDEAREVVQNGNVTVFEAIPARDLIIRKGDTYYAIRFAGGRSPPLGGWVPKLRWLMWLGTVPLSFGAMWQWT